MTSTGIFFQLFKSKTDILGLHTSNTVSSNSLSPVLAKFKNFTISPYLPPKLQLEQVWEGDASESDLNQDELQNIFVNSNFDSW